MATENETLACEHPVCAHAIQLRHTPVLASSIRSCVLATVYYSGSYQNLVCVSLGAGGFHQRCEVSDHDYEGDGQPFLGYQWRSPSS